MAGKNKKTESDFIKELEALEQQKKEATEQLKAYLKSQSHTRAESSALQSYFYLAQVL